MSATEHHLPDELVMVECADPDEMPSNLPSELGHDAREAYVALRYFAEMDEIGDPRSPTHEEIATLAGMSPERLFDALAELRERGVLEADNLIGRGGTYRLITYTLARVPKMG